MTKARGSSQHKAFLSNQSTPQSTYINPCSNKSKRQFSSGLPLCSKSRIIAAVALVILVILVAIVLLVVVVVVVVAVVAALASVGVDPPVSTPFSKRKS